MKNFIRASLVAATLMAPVVSQAGTALLLDHVHMNFAARSDAALTPAKVREAIVAAGMQHGWTVSAEQPGQLTLSNVVRDTFKVVINVSYDASGMTADYVSSENLGYRTYTSKNTPYIHPKYNKWVHRLMKDVSVSLAETK
jgi:hypothetical protein